MPALDKQQLETHGCVWHTQRHTHTSMNVGRGRRLPPPPVDLQELAENHTPQFPGSTPTCTVGNKLLGMITLLLLLARRDTDYTVRSVCVAPLESHKIVPRN